MWSLRLVGIFVVAAQGILASSFGTHVVKERLAEVPRGWKYHSKVPSGYPLKLKIALPQPKCVFISFSAAFKAT
jgi:hypothetical protein